MAKAHYTLMFFLQVFFFGFFLVSTFPKLSRAPIVPKRGTLSNITESRNAMVWKKGTHRVRKFSVVNILNIFHDHWQRNKKAGQQEGETYKKHSKKKQTTPRSQAFQKDCFE